MTVPEINYIAVAAASAHEGEGGDEHEREGHAGGRHAFHPSEKASPDSAACGAGNCLAGVEDSERRPLASHHHRSRAVTDAPYDFSGLHRPMSRHEARERRRGILAGASLWRALEVEHVAGLLVVGGINLFIVIPLGVLSAFAAVAASPAIHSAADVAGMLLMLVGAPLAAAAITYVSMRPLIIPPRWRAWVRMHRFAEENSLEFVREEEGVRIPGTLTPSRSSFRPPRLYGGFRDPERGILLGDWVLPAVTPRGFGDWLGVIVVQSERFAESHRLGQGAIRDLLGDAAGSWSLEVQTVPGSIVAIKHLPFRTRNAAQLEQAFRIAWILHEAAAVPRR